MKKLSKSLALFALALSLSNTVSLPKANAFGLMDLAMTGRLNYVGVPQNPVDLAATVACVIFLPICILDGDATGSDINASDLLENGYTNAEVEEILKGQKAVQSYLNANQVQITQEGPLNSEELARELEIRVPDTTKAYLDFVSENF